jgi:endogenous inhibitor of DNA gyrase (YacG/DUF329 family)
MARSPACPICGKPSAEKTRPFCGARCADVDLGRWFGEAYRVPAEPLAEPDSLPAPDDEA